MSKDLKLLHRCPHEIRSEWVALSGDRQTLRPASPPVSNPRITLNGVNLPSQGLFKALRVVGTRRAPFPIVFGRNDLVSFEFNGQPFEVFLTPGPRQSAEALVSNIRDALTGVKGLVVKATPEGRVCFESSDEVPGKVLRFTRGSAHETIGIPPSKLVQTTLIYPPWRLIQASIDPLDKVFRFDRPLLSLEGVFEVSYVTASQSCARCGGLNIENDIRYTDRGDFRFIENEDLLLQEVDKIVLTIRGSNIYHSWYGTRLVDLLGKRISTSSGGVLEGQIQTEISNALDRYKSIKISQARLVPVSPRELLDRVRTIDVRQDPENPTIFTVRIEILNIAGSAEVLEETLVIPGVATTDGFLRRF